MIWTGRDIPNFLLGVAGGIQYLKLKSANIEYRAKRDSHCRICQEVMRNAENQQFQVSGQGFCSIPLSLSTALKDS